MPLISKKGIYGLSAMHELSKNSKKNTPMRIKDISQKANVPQNYLEQLLNKLRHAGLVNSVRGIKGGYILAQKPEDISIGDILVTLEDDIKVIEQRSEKPILNLFFDDAKITIKAYFDVSLTKLDEYQSRYNKFLHYDI